MSGRQLRGLVADRRARIPFALFGILLLVSAGALVFGAETQEESTASLDPDHAMERTSGAVRTATRDAVSQASELAAREPLTDTADTAFGEVLDRHSRAGAITDRNDPFDAYLRALIYLEAQETLETAGQQVGDIRTEVSLPEISDADSFEDAIGRVRLTAGIEDSELEPGLLRVTLSNVTTVLRHDGEEIDRRTESVTVTVPTPVVQLHERTETFQSRLDAGVTERGFTQRFNARIYALGWARGYAQYSGMPVTEVIANRHIVPSANDALYRTQQDVFGRADPQLGTAVRRGWLCMALQDAEKLYNGYRPKRTGYADDLCEAGRWLFGDRATGELPDPPETGDLMAETPGLDATQTVGVNETATLPLRRLASSAGEHSIEGAVDRVFEIEAGVESSISDVSGPKFRHTPPDSYELGRSRQISTTNEETNVYVREVTEHTEPEQYYTVTGAVALALEEQREHTYRDEDGTHSTTTSATGTLAAEFEIELRESDPGPNTDIDAYQASNGSAVGIDLKYERGPADTVGNPTVPEGGQPGGFQNYKGAEAEILATFAGGTGHNDIENWLETRWESATTPEELSFRNRRTVRLDHTALSEGRLKETVIRDITSLQEEIRNVSIRFERSEIVHDGDGTGPYGKLLRKLRDEKEAYLERSQPYENVGQKAVYEARYAYFESLESDLERLEAANDEAMGSLDDELGDLDLGSALSYFEQGTAATQPDPVAIESSSLTANVSYEVSGAPTYLVTENVTSREVPAVKNSVEAFAPLATRNENYLKLPYDSVVAGLLNRIADLFGFGDPDAKLTLRMAGEALQAGRLAEDATRAEENETYADARSLGRKTDELEASVESAVEQFRTDVTEQIVLHLYPDDVRLPCTDGECTLGEVERIKAQLGDGVSCSTSGCEYHVDYIEACGEIACRVTENFPADRGREQIEAAANTVIDDPERSTAETAIAIDEGEITEPLVDEIAHRVDSRPQYAISADDEQFRAYLESAVQPAVTRAANSREVTLGDTETIEDLDTEIRQALEQVSEDILEDRFEEHFGGEEFDIGEYDDWVNGVETPVRVPAGMPLLPLPSHWFATVNVWDVEVGGEYARFEVTANMSSPETDRTIAYVREERTVTREIADGSRTLGRVEPIEFSGRSVLVVVVPPGGIGVGDRDDDDPDCSPTWPVTGPVDSEIDCG